MANKEERSLRKLHKGQKKGADKDRKEGTGEFPDVPADPGDIRLQCYEKEKDIGQY